MEIKYLKPLRDTKLKRSANRGMSLAQIEALENIYNDGKPFPKAYREFLYLAGEFCNLGTGISDFHWMQEMAREEVAASGKTIGRPYWVTDQLDRCEQFGFVYLDEDTEDPVIYNCNADKSYHKEFGFIAPRPQGTFSKYIESHIDDVLLTESFRK